MINSKVVLSIIIPAYNVEDYIDTCIKSLLLAEIMDEIEVLVIDDGSTDNTALQVLKLQEMYPKTIRLISKENGGHGSVLNRGISEARGKYFKVVDGDDWVVNSSFGQFVDYLANNDADIIISDYSRIFEKNGKRKTVKYGRDSSVKYSFDEVASGLRELSIHAIAYRTELLKENKICFTERCYYEDNEYCLYPLAFVSTISFFKGEVYQYRIGREGQSISPESVRRNFEMQRTIVWNLIEFGQSINRDASSQVLDYIDSFVVTNIRRYYGAILKQPFDMSGVDIIVQTTEDLKEYPMYFAKSKRFGIGLLQSKPRIFYPLAYGAFRALRFVRGY